jgi:hypothetical protein
MAGGNFSIEVLHMPERESALAVLSPASAPDIELPIEPTYHLVARNPQQMAAASANLQSWLDKRIEAASAEVSELERARDEAKLHKWRTSAYNNAISKANSRLRYYIKIEAAVKAGYTIVPNFPVDVFAIRVRRPNVVTPNQVGSSYGGKADYLAEPPDVAELGTGKYVSPKPSGYHTTDETKSSDGKITKRDKFVSMSLQPPEFPFSVAVPEVMSATAEAMALRVFDQIGICPQTSKRGKGDPLIIGQVILETGSMYRQNRDHKKPVSFLIAWHLDLRTL